MSLPSRGRRFPLTALLALTLSLALAAPAGAAPRGLGVAREDPGVTLGGAECDLIPVPAAPTATFDGITPCPGVRPGAALLTDAGLCSFNFLFSGSDGGRYMGTAGHCTLLDPMTGAVAGGGESAEEVYPPGAGPVAMNGTGDRIGEFAYAVLSDPKDFALVRLDPDVEADPQMCHFGGPTGINADRPPVTQPTILHQYGQGIVIGSVMPARSLVALGMPDPDHVFAQGIVLPGDSGSPVTSADGRAVGVAVTVGAHSGGTGVGGIDTGSVGITRLTPQIDRAEEQLGIDLTLVTAETL